MKYFLYQVKRLKNDGTRKAGPEFRYEVRNEYGMVIDSRETDKDFIAACTPTEYANHKGWSYVGRPDLIKRGGVVALLVDEK